MWYIEILEQLAVKFPPDDQEKIKSFFHTLLTKFKKEFYPEESLPLELSLGLIDKTYFYLENAKQYIKAEDFCRHFFGLLMVYGKSSEDLSDLWSIDFSSYLQFSEVFTALNSDKHLHQLKMEMLETVRKMDTPNKVNFTSQMAVKTYLNQTEVDALMKLDHRTGINFEHLQEVFSQLNDKSTLEDLYLEAKDIPNKEKEFDEFLAGMLEIANTHFISIGHSHYKVPVEISDAIFQLELSEDEYDFLEMISALEPKLNNLFLIYYEEPDFSNYYIAARLEQQLLQASFTYFREKSFNAFKQFKKTCEAAINDALDANTVLNWQEDLVTIQSLCERLGNAYQGSVNLTPDSNRFFKSPIVPHAENKDHSHRIRLSLGSSQDS